MPYLGFEPTASDTLSVFRYVATSSQTTFTGADSGGATLSYDVGNGSCQVWLNGVRLDSSDITATNGTSVVLAACTTGDIVHIQATKAFIPADVVPKAAGGTFDGAVVVGAGATVPSGQTLTIASGATIANSGTATGFSASTLAASTTVGTGAEADTKIVFDGHAQDYYIGLDDTDDDFKIGLGSAVGTTSHMVFDETGAITKPLQPAFSAYNSGTDSNETGDNSEVNIDYNTEVFDTNSDFASDTFTAPVTGKYFLQCQVGFQQTEDATNTRYRVLIRTSNRDYIMHEQRVMRQNDGGQNIVLLNGSVVADMDANDTAIVRGAVYGGTAVVDIWGNSQPETFFSGCLLA